MSQILWLASYPKSGNTWLRAFLANLARPDDAPADINRLSGHSTADRNVFDDLVGVKASDLTLDEIDEYRPELYRLMAGRSPETLHIKAHDAYTFGRDGQRIFPADVSLGPIYLVRNPLEIAVSYSHHLGRAN